VKISFPAAVHGQDRRGVRGDQKHLADAIPDPVLR
jgi:hypothetical protein